LPVRTSDKYYPSRPLVAFLRLFSVKFPYRIFYAKTAYVRTNIITVRRFVVRPRYVFNDSKTDLVLFGEIKKPKPERVIHR